MRDQRDLPSMKLVDDKMQAGYAALENGDTLKACRLWLETWREILDIIDQLEMKSLDEFDIRFRGAQCVINWIQDLESELHNAGLKEPRFYRERIALCETILERFPDETLLIGNFQAALAESHFELGDRETGDRLFRGWLEETPQWGWGWIAWSDCYWLFAKADRKDAARAEQILHQGLESPEVEDRADILKRLLILYEETGRDKEAEVVREQIDRAQERKTSTTTRFGPGYMQVKQRYDFGEEGLPLEELPNLARAPQPGRPADRGSSEGKHRVGRNDPCPCGSGKKFKKCCARKLQ
jgi:hypothetical protein